MLMLLFYFFFLSIFLVFFSDWKIMMTMYFFFVPFLCFQNFSFSFLSKNFFFSLDIFSFLMLFLTLWIVVLSVFSSSSIFLSLNLRFFLLCFNLLTFFLVLSFVSNNLLFFFFFFESTLIPTLFVILGWGYKIERLKSGYYMFFYTLLGSLPMLSIVFGLSRLNNCLVFGFMENNIFFFFFYLFSIFAFLIKMPMFLVHSWLPKAHVEAPVSGSMILAGVLLKLGGYGVFRLMFLYKLFFFNYFWLFVSIWGGLLSGFICLRQTDLKSLIAFSSVSHMSVVILGFLMFSDWGVWGSFMIMVAHGLCSSGMFFLANVLYERSGTRSMFLNKGMLSIYPSLSLWWFMFCLSNMAGPPSLNLLGEIFLFNVVLSWSFFFLFFLMCMSFLSGAYNLFLFSFCHHGKPFSNLFFFNPCSVREFLICFCHWFPLNLFFLKLDLFF